MKIVISVFFAKSGCIYYIIDFNMLEMLVTWHDTPQHSVFCRPKTREELRKLCTPEEIATVLLKDVKKVRSPKPSSVHFLHPSTHFNGTCLL